MENGIITIAFVLVLLAMLSITLAYTPKDKELQDKEADNYTMVPLPTFTELQGRVDNLEVKVDKIYTVIVLSSLSYNDTTP